MALRVQLSLLFQDENLYNNLILPYKQERALNSLIIKCLSSYFYREDVRNLIESSEDDEVNDEVSSSFQDSQSICDNIRNSLAMQSFLAQELKQEIENGTEDISNIISNVNKKAEETGMVKPTTSEFNNSVWQIELKDNIDISKDTNPASNPSSSNSDFNFIYKILLMMGSVIGDKNIINELNKHGNTTMKVNEPKGVDEPIRIEEPIEVSEPEESYSTDEGEEIVSGVSEEVVNTSVVEEVVEDDISEPEVIPSSPDIIEEEDNDAEDSLKELYASLF